MTLLALRDLVKRYPTPGAGSALAVDHVSLDLRAGQLAAVHGPSGSGKTTLLLIAAGLLAPDRGTVLFDGREIARLAPREAARYRRREIGFVFQSFHLVAGASALENAAMKMLADGSTLREACAAAEPLLQRLGLGQRLSHPVDRLSMGERQRVAIARALLNEPRLLLADEPTGSLDTKWSAQILGLLRELAHERDLATLLVTHDPQASAFADSVHTLRDGALSDGAGVVPASMARVRAATSIAG